MAGAGIGIASLATASSATGGAADGGPGIEWRRSYHGNEREYEFVPRVFDGTSTGGFVIAGEGAPISATGPEDTQFGCLLADAAGAPEWLAFGLDDHEAALSVTADVLETASGTFVLAGTGEYPVESEPDRWDQPVARAAAFDDQGDVRWTVVFDEFGGSDDGAIVVDDQPRFAALTRGTDHGAVAVGSLGSKGWAVKFDDDGTVEWQQDFGEVRRFANAFTVDEGYRLHAVRDDETVILDVDTDGSVVDEIVLAVDYDAIPHNHVVIPIDDGGYALTGRYEGRQRMVLQTFDETGSSRWLETYNGPYDGYDWAHDVIQTADGGFALFGRMDAAYTGEAAPAVVKTDSTGSEEWRTLIDETDVGAHRRGIQTSDGGIVAFTPGSSNLLVKHAAGIVNDGESAETSDGDADNAETGNGSTASDAGNGTQSNDSPSDNASAGAVDGATASEGGDDGEHDEASGLGLLAAIGALGGAVAYTRFHRRDGRQ